MTDEMFNRSSFLAQALRQDNQHVLNNTGDIYNLSAYAGSQQSGSTSTFYTQNQNNSDQTPPAYVHHLFPNSEHSDWKVENADVSALSLTEASTRENFANDRRSHKIYQTDSIEENTNNVRSKLIKTGQMERLNELVERRLSEVGWRLDMMAYSRAIVKKTGSSITFEELFQKLKESAKERIPKNVEEEVVQKIKYCYESAIPSKD